MKIGRSSNHKILTLNLQSMIKIEVHSFMIHRLLNHFRKVDYHRDMAESKSGNYKKVVDDLSMKAYEVECWRKWSESGVGLEKGLAAGIITHMDVWLWDLDNSKVFTVNSLKRGCIWSDIRLQIICLSGINGWPKKVSIVVWRAETTSNIKHFA